MKRLKTILLFTGLSILGVNFSSCQNTTNSHQVSSGGKISVNEFEQKLNSEKNVQLIDVRTPEEYESGFIKGAKNIDWNGAGFETEINKLDKTKTVYVYCLGGGRSGSAAARMKELGFKDIYDLQGGMMAWNNAGKPVITPNNAQKEKGMSEEEFNQLIKSDKFVLVDFNAPWCGPCKKMAPMLEELSNEQKSKMQLVKINIDANKELAKKLKIEELPTLILYYKGVIFWKKSGLTEKGEILQKLNSK